MRPVTSFAFFCHSTWKASRIVVMDNYSKTRRRPSQPGPKQRKTNSGNPWPAGRPRSRAPASKQFNFTEIRNTDQAETAQNKVFLTTRSKPWLVGKAMTNKWPCTKGTAIGSFMGIRFGWRKTGEEVVNVLTLLSCSCPVRGGPCGCAEQRPRMQS
jgi:hypothetical protein